MPNGKRGDNPVTDIVHHNKKIFGTEVDALIREIDAATSDYGVFDPFKPVTQLLFDAEADRSLVPQLHRELLALLGRRPPA